MSTADLHANNNNNDDDDDDDDHDDKNHICTAPYAKTQRQ